MNRKYAFLKKDFDRPPRLAQKHLDLKINFRADNTVEVDNTLYLELLEETDHVTLNARDLEIEKVERVDTAPRDLDFEYDPSASTLRIPLGRKAPGGTETAIHTRTLCFPSDHILEGIYKDTTPPGCPQQYMSQCQQWGFERIAPVLDDCRAKCTMTTTVEADSRYTHLISNGDVSRKHNPDGIPVKKAGDPSRCVITYVNSIPMAPYLFIVCVGTWEVLEDEVVYPSGRRVKLEYLVPPGRKAGAEIPMRILKRSVLWQGKTQDYEYRREVYRTICMEKSNWGGMENVGNTTIVTDAALVDEYTEDSRLEYCHGVILHEFEHNQCGSDVTMETPFDMWLNEAFTVDVEQQFLAEVFGPAYMRLKRVDSIRDPVSGPLAIEQAGHMGNIVRNGFNDPDELVDSVTYVKSAEIIRMLKLILGEQTFRKAKNLYFNRYSGSNANTDQFFVCFEEASGRDLSQFKKQWLYTIGYPEVAASWRYDKSRQTVTVNLRQETGNGPFHIPLEIAAVDNAGKDIPGTARVVEMDTPSASIELEDVPSRPAFMSLNRNCSFYGTFSHDAPLQELEKQALKDPNLLNRVEAMRKLTDMERIKLLENPADHASDRWQTVFRDILSDTETPFAVKSYLLKVDEQPLDRRYSTRYRELYKARIKLISTLSVRWAAGLREQYERVKNAAGKESLAEQIERRRLKAVLLELIAAARTAETMKLCEEQFRMARNITEKLSALRIINRTAHPGRRQFIEEAHELWKNHLSAYSGYLRAVGLGTEEDVFEMLAAEEQRSSFSAEHPTLSRSLYVPFTLNNKMLWTDKGIRWVTDTVIKMAGINENTAIRIVRCFQHAHSLAPDLKPRVLKALEEILSDINRCDTPALFGRVEAYLRH
ncbi:MAG: M1 family metallopeptidase [Kiritimatiellia bacterium]